MHSPFQPEGEKPLRDSETEQDARRLSEWMARSAAGLRRSRSERGTCERFARGRAQPEVGAAGRPRGSEQTILVATSTQKAGGPRFTKFSQQLVYIGTRNAEETREPVGSRPGV